MDSSSSSSSSSENKVDRTLFLSVGLIICTAIMFIFTIALYDLIYQITTYYGLFGQTVKADAGFSPRQIGGQFVLAAILLVAGTWILYYFHPFGTETASFRVPHSPDYVTPTGAYSLLTYEPLLRHPIIPIAR